MKKYLLPENGKFFKANLHCHSTFSDGKLSPEQLKEEYMARGYSIIAFTDHNILVSHNHLSDENFLALNGMEIDFYEGWNPEFIDEGKTYLTWKGCHLNFISLSADNITQPCFHRTKNRIIGTGDKYSHLIKFDSSKPDFEKHYSPEGVSRAIKEARDCGFFVIYNHPAWSFEDYNFFLNYNGLHAMEICNNASVVEGLDDYTPRTYDDFLRAGHKIFCVGADDNHNKFPLDSRKCDSFGAFTMIKADKLDYPSIASALLSGNFYASQGPEIYSLIREDDMVTIECSPCDKIRLTTDNRRCNIVYDENGQGITKATFALSKECKYFRLTITDKFGKNANTNAYFINE